MKKGIKLEKETLGEGREAQRGNKVTIQYTWLLNKGDILQNEMTYQFKLGQREVIAGLEYAVEGMKVGGRRRVKVGPHLAYRDVGVPDIIPPNAVLIFEIELISVDD